MNKYILLPLLPLCIWGCALEWKKNLLKESMRYDLCDQCDELKTLVATNAPEDMVKDAFRELSYQFQQLYSEGEYE